MSFPNQKIVQIAPRIKRDAKNLFAMMNIEALQAAIRDLKGSALKMWLYFNKNQDNYHFELSQKACSEWGIKRDSYYAGIDELEEKGYLLPIYEGSNIYNFYETPPSEKLKSEKPRVFSETENQLTDFQNSPSVFPQRNNTNITEIKQNRTIVYSNYQNGFCDNAFAVGESGGSGKAATAKKDNYDRFGDMPQEKKEWLANMGF